MKYADDFRRIARNALRGNWRIAVLTGFVASLIGANIATSGGGGGSSGNDSSNNVPSNLQTSELFELIYPILLIILAVLVIWLIVTAIIGGAGKLGYAKFNLNLVDRNQAAFSDLFSQFDRLGTGFCMNFLSGLYIFLWSLLFIIPGIVKAYSYAMTPYILAEHPEMTANEAITESRYIMHGNKWRLFCLEFSFIGWELLCIVPSLILLPLIFIGSFGLITWIILVFATVFVGNLFLTPYREAAHAAFYREVSLTNLPLFNPITQDSGEADYPNQY